MDSSSSSSSTERNGSVSNSGRSSPFIRERKVQPPAKPARRPSVGSAAEFFGGLPPKEDESQVALNKILNNLNLEDPTKKNRRSASYSVVETTTLSSATYPGEVPPPQQVSLSPRPLDPQALRSATPSSSSSPSVATSSSSSSLTSSTSKSTPTTNRSQSTNSVTTPSSPSISASPTSTAALRKRTPPSSGSKDNLLAPTKPPRKISGASSTSSPSLPIPASSSVPMSSPSLSSTSPASSSQTIPTTKSTPEVTKSPSPSSPSTSPPSPSSTSLKLTLPSVSTQPSPPESSSPSWSRGLVSPRTTATRGPSPFVKSATIQTLPQQSSSVSPRNSPILSSPRAVATQTSPRNAPTTSSSSSSSSSSAPSQSSISNTSPSKASPSSSTPKATVSKQVSPHPPLTKAASKNSSMVVSSTTTRTSTALEHFKKEHAIKKWLSEALQSPQLLECQSLQEGLRDGVLLCKLMLVVADESAIPKIHEPAEKEKLPAFKSKENISFFLYALEEFGIERAWRFQVEDLFDDRNMVKVMDCLYALANFQKKVDPPPLISEVQIQESTIPQQRMAIVKLNLTQMQMKEEKSKKQTALAEATRNRSRTFAPSTGARPPGFGGGGGFGAPSPAELRQQQRKQAEEVEKRIVKFQAIVRGRIARKRYRKIVRDVAYREKVAKEILATEELYLKNLTLLSTAFLFPMNLMGFTQAEWLKGMISNVEVIVNYSKLLLSKLKPRVEGWTPRTCLGDIFLQITNFLKVYTQYVKAYNQSLGELRKMKQEPKFQQFLKTAAKTPGVEKTEINSFLILPVQRIPRYEMLLKDLLKHTDPSHVDYKNLQDASTKVVEVAAYVDEKKGEAENIYKVLELQDLFGSSFADLAKPHRRFVFEGVCQVLVKNKAEERKVVIFNDIAVVASREKKKKQERFKVERNFPLFGVSLTKLPQANGALRWGFDLRTANGSVLVTLYSKSQEELSKWEKYFNGVFKEIEQSIENRVPGTLTSLLSPRATPSPASPALSKNAPLPPSVTVTPSSSSSSSSSSSTTTSPSPSTASASASTPSISEGRGSKVSKLVNRTENEEENEEESKGSRKRANSS